MKERVQLRVTGLPNDVESWLHIMKRSPGTEIIQQSKPYKNRGSQKVRIYVSIAFSDELQCDTISTT